MKGQIKLLKIMHKNNPEIMKKILKKHINMNHFPEIWKLGKIKLVNKPGKNPSEINSYRIITLLSIP